MDRMICKKDHDLFLFSHSTYVLDICEAILTNIQNKCLCKVSNAMYSCIICDRLLPLKRRFRDSQIVIITNFVVVSNVGIKRIVCITVSRINWMYTYILLCNTSPIFRYAGE